MDTQNKTQLSFQLSLERDCSHIVEAIRRLKDGTWHLDQEDSDWVDHLIPKIKSALIDHIDFEHRVLFPKLPASQAKAHLEEHQRILALLHAIENASKEKNVEDLHGLLDVLTTAINFHHEHFGCEILNDKYCSEDGSSERIQRRALCSNLEGL